MLLLIMLQPTPLAKIDFDLATLKPSPGDCRHPTAGSIVVCARRANAARIVDRPIEPLLPKAEIGVTGKLRAGINGQQGNVGGFRSNRIMVTAKLPF